MIGTFSTPYIIPRWVEHRVTLMTFLFLLGASTFLIGPFYGDLNLPVMLIGLTISGISLGPLVIPNMTEMMNATALKHPDCDLEHASSLLSGILNCCMGMGMGLGPILGGFLYDYTDFQTMNNIIGGFCIAMAVLYFICAEGCDAFRQTCINFSRRNHVKAEKEVGLVPVKAASTVMILRAGSVLSNSHYSGVLTSRANSTAVSDSRANSVTHFLATSEREKISVHSK